MEKAWHAQQIGALAVIIYDTDEANDASWVDMIQDGNVYKVRCCHRAEPVLGGGSLRLVGSSLLFPLFGSRFSQR